MKIDINYKPHSGQKEAKKLILEHDPDFVSICAGRGFGKTFFGMGEIALPALMAIPNCQILWVAPFNSTCRTPIDEFFIPNVPKFTENRTQLWEYYYQKNELHWKPNGSKIFFKSAENADSIVSKGYNIILVDEAALIAGSVFHQQILACARKGNPKIILFSTPRGKNWFYDYYQRGLDPDKPKYLSIHMPWWKNPDYSKVLSELMNDLPKHIIEQEYEAKFIDDGGTVFSGVRNVLYTDPIVFNSKDQFWQDPDHVIGDDKLYVLGWDLAKENDFNVIVVAELTENKIVEYHRENKTDYKTILNKIVDISAKYNYAELIYDATGVGAGVGDFLDKSLNTVPYKFTNESKNELINKLIVTIQNKQIKLPNINSLVLELESFSFNISKTGKITYSAPSGMHDDIVIALSLANYYVLDRYDPQDIKNIDDIIDLNNNSGPRSFRDWMYEDND